MSQQNNVKLGLNGMMNGESKACSFAVNMSSFRSAFALTFCISITPKNCIKKRLCHRCFPVDFAKFCEFFYRNLRMTAPETVTETNLGNSVRNGKLHIISPVDV